MMLISFCGLLGSSFQNAVIAALLSFSKGVGSQHEYIYIIALIKNSFYIYIIFHTFDHPFIIINNGFDKY